MDEPKKNPTEYEDLDPELVEQAIRAGEQAAQEEISRDADRIRQERDDLAKRLGDLSDEVDRAKGDAKDAQDRLARLRADWDNYRKRTAAERVAERAFATERLVESLLPAIDDLERAVEHARGSEGGADLADGVAAVHAKILDVLKSQGVEAIDPAGEPFDPLEAQAVGRVEDTEAYDDTVASVMRKGYRMGTKVIRPAMVSVTFGGPRRPAEKDGQN